MSLCAEGYYLIDQDDQYTGSLRYDEPSLTAPTLSDLIIMLITREEMNNRPAP